MTEVIFHVLCDECEEELELTEVKHDENGVTFYVTKCETCPCSN